MYTSFVISLIVFALIAVRQLLPGWVRIWHVMGAGALAVLFLGEISPRAALLAVDWDVLFYLFGVFSIAASLHVNGFSEVLIAKVSDRFDLERWGLLALMGFTAVTAAILTNDAAAVVGTPLALVLARSLKVSPVVPLIALCAAATIGSLLTPVGNPQNVLIAAKGHFSDPIGTFFSWLAVPAAISFLFAFLWLSRCLARSRAKPEDSSVTLPRYERTRSWPALSATAFLVVLVLGDSLVQGQQGQVLLPLGAIGLIAALPVFCFDRHRLKVLGEVDWATLVFFIAMFIVTSAVLSSGVLQTWLAPVQDHLEEPSVIFLLGFWGSQLFSNVPTVEIYLNLIEAPDAAVSMLLAASSTLAGNLFILSAASNVIVVQQAEKLGARPFSFWQFFALCLPITLVSLAVSYLWLLLLV
ncbi:MAG: anion transporter [Rhodospirillales bacterium]